VVLEDGPTGLFDKANDTQQAYKSTRFTQLGISVSLGLVAIWCMHYVGNRAIILGDGTADLQLVYNPGFTALSAFLPIIFLFAGFSLVELRQSSERYFWPFLLGSGVIAGLAITGMHYIGNFGVDNYSLSNPAGFIVGAAAIAIAASFGALALFYYFREKWVNSFPRRIGCAIVLAGAVCGMHWVASVGTTYRLKTMQEVNGISRNINLIVALVCVSLKRMSGTSTNPPSLFSLALSAWSLPFSPDVTEDNWQIVHSTSCWHLQSLIRKVVCWSRKRVCLQPEKSPSNSIKRYVTTFSPRNILITAVF
jgi:NO-binding membrane sensor protein with MHYT domain